MGSISKKILACALTLTLTSILFPGVGSAQTVEELQAQIAQLQSQLQQLLQQLAQVQGGRGTGISGIPAGFTFQKNLYYGMSDPDVRYLQIVLNSDPDTRVATSGAGSPGNETQYFGSLTKAAVIKFQEKYADEILTPWGLTKGTGFVGSITRAKLNALITTPTPTCSDYTTEAACTAGGCYWYDSACHSEPKPTPSFQPLTVSLATDTPAGGNIVRGSANTPVTKLIFTGATNSDTTITGLTVTSFGTADLGTSDISAVKIYDGTRMLASRNLIVGKAYFVFAPGVVVPANGTKTLTITADIATGATIMAGVQLGINSASDIISTSAFSGNFPIKGNTFLIVPGGSIGSISVTAGPALYYTSMKVGEKDQVLGQFYVSAGSNEDVEIYQVNVKNNGTTSDSDIANLRLVVDNTTVSGPVTFSSKKATFDLATPVTITKGQSKLFKVIGDIAGVTSGSSTIVIYIDSASVLARGKTSGVGIGNSGTYTAQTITIGRGTLAVSVSPNTPKGSAAQTIKSTIPQVLGVFSIRAIGEDIMLNKVKLTFTPSGSLTMDATHPLKTVGLYDGDTLLTSLVDVTSSSAYTFTLNWIIPANTAKDLTVKGITHDLSGEGNLTVALGGSNSLVGTGMVSSGTEGSENINVTSSLTLNPISIYNSGTFATAISDTLTPPNVYVLSGVNGVVLGALKIRADRENQQLYTLKLTVHGATTGQLNGLTLYDENGVTPLSKTVSEGTGATYTFTTSDFLSPINLNKGEWKTILVKGDVSGTASATNFYFEIANTADLKTICLESGQIAQAPTTFDFRISSPYAGGTVLGFIPDVLEITKDSQSPSGTVGRSNNATVAIWEFNIRSNTSSSVDVYRLTLNSKTGLPSGATSTSLYKLVDADTGQSIASSAASVDVSTGTVVFGAGTSKLFTVQYGVPKRIALQIDTTNTTTFPPFTHLLFRIPSASLLASGAPLQTVVLSSATSGTGTISVSDGSANITGSGTAFLTELPVGSVIITAGGQERIVVSVSSNTAATAHANFTSSESGGGSGVAYTIKAARGIGFGGTVYSIPAEANEVIFQ